MSEIEGAVTPDNPGETDIFREWFPRSGDRLFTESDRAASVDCTGYSNPFSNEPRSPIGRWGLYTDGFLIAGDRLVEGFTGTAPEDALIYPVLALYRHHLELELKGLVRQALNYSVADKANIERGRGELSNTHGLKALWNMLQMHFPQSKDWAIPEQHAAFEALLFEFDEHDPNSQAARYPWDKKECQTLTRLRRIDLPAVKASIHKMSNYLWCFHEGIIQANEAAVEI